MEKSSTPLTKQTVLDYVKTNFLFGPVKTLQAKLEELKVDVIVDFDPDQSWARLRMEIKLAKTKMDAIDSSNLSSSIYKATTLQGIMELFDAEIKLCERRIESAKEERKPERMLAYMELIGIYKKCQEFITRHGYIYDAAALEAK